VELDAPVTSSFWQFSTWSDGGPAAHSFTMPNHDLTLAARYSTAIDVKYAELGGASSFLGRPTTTEYDIAGGRARNYAGGRLYWSANTGAHEVHRAILTKYLAGGGPSSFGFPTTDEIAVPGGRASYFTTARIYWSSTTAAHFSRGALLTKYLAAGGPSAYGLPVTDDSKVTGGWYANFSGGRSIYWSSTTKAHLVYGAILRKYASMGYQSSCLGFPSTDEYGITGGRQNRFAGGSITYLAGVGTTARC
jgi:uncharacterized protein with LGFP repeats